MHIYTVEPKWLPSFNLTQLEPFSVDGSFGSHVFIYPHIYTSTQARSLFNYDKQAYHKAFCSNNCLACFTFWPLVFLSPH